MTKPGTIAARDDSRLAPDLFPMTGSTREQLRFLLRYAVLAPSSHNTQPWLFRLTDDAVELCADRSRALPVADPGHRELTISCGAALFHLRTAIRCFGHEPAVDRSPMGPDPDLLARVTPGAPLRATDADRQLFEAMPARATNRRPFEQRAVPRAVLAELEEAARVEGATLHAVSSDAGKSELAALIAEGDRRQFDDRAFRRELAAWSRPNHTQRGDGIPGYGLGLTEASSLASPLILRTFDIGAGQAARDSELATHSPLLAVIASDGDSPHDWLRTGEALARVLLLIQARGLSASFLNPPVQVTELRWPLRDLLEAKGFPQIVLRMGYGPRPRPTPRRAVEETTR